MRKYVYLFELDSVRKTDAEIIAGQRALYDEIVKNGNVVVLTYNQLIDSRAFFSLLNNKKYYKSIIGLFEKGYIRISQFGSVRTIAQYLLNTVDSEDNRFIYSALPIKSSQRRLVELIKRSIMYSDLSEINEYIYRLNRSDNELKDLFVEVETVCQDGEKKAFEKSSDLKIAEMENVLKNLYWLLGTALRLSTVHDIFIPPRDPSEYAHFKLSDYLNYIAEVKPAFENSKLWYDAINTLKQLNCWGLNNRSLYFHELKMRAEKESADKKVLQYAQAVVSICTNYAYEMSICNISKHYNAVDLQKKASAESSFFKDFYKRLEQHWNAGFDAENRFLLGETNLFTEFTDITEIPDFELAARVVFEVEAKERCEILPRYEYDLKQQRRIQKLSLLKKVPRQTTSLFFGVIFAILFNVLFEAVHCLYDGEFSPLLSWSAFLNFGIDTIAFFVIGEFVTTVISKKIPSFLSLSEATEGLVNVFKDACRLFFSKADTYASECCVNHTEKRSHSFPIDFLESDELKKYTKFYKCHPDLVKPVAEYPIADVTDRNKLKAIVRNQELYKRKYGVVYSSEYNTVVVDPVESDNNGFYSYERVVPSSMNNGVVLFAVHNENIVLMRQFRHAVRKAQLCCPRGFGEALISTEENAKKELYEELKATVVENPVVIGSVTADSGLSSGAATVYLMKIDKYSFSGKEGIYEIVEVKPNKMREMIKRGEIDDGYTLAAFTLYSAYILS